MIKIRRSKDRGHANHGWLNACHTFSFADYYDPSHMGFSVLRVINEDRIQGGTGFGTHGHRDMEIITYIVDGALEHQDSMGTKAVIVPGEVQRMSAGSGVQHSEHNKQTNKQTHLLQIWILPKTKGIQPSYEQKSFANELKKNTLILVCSPTGRDGSISINQDVELFACKSEKSGAMELPVSPGRRIWIQVINGEVKIDNDILNLGDGAGVESTTNIKLNWKQGSEFLVFDLP